MTTTRKTPKKSKGLSKSEQLKRNICANPKKCHDIDCYDCGSRPQPRGKFGADHVTIEDAKMAWNRHIPVIVNGKKFLVYPNDAMKVLIAYGKEKASQGLQSQYGEHAYLKLNDKYSLHLGDTYSKDDVCKGAGMKIFDVAVPQQWLDMPENKKKFYGGEWAVWSYDGKNRTFGAPVWRTEIFEMLKRNILKSF